MILEKLFLILLVVSSAALGFGYVDAIGLGSPLPGTDPVSHGFGGVASLGVGNMSLFGNPAGIEGNSSRIDIAIGPHIMKETVDDGAGKHSLTYAGLGAAGCQALFGTGNTVFALGFARVRDYTYKGEYFFREENPDSAFIIAGFENITVSGGVFEAAAGAAIEALEGVSIGASAGYRFGNINYDYYWHHFSESIDDSSSAWSREEGELAWRAGATANIGNGAKLGASFSSESENCPSTLAAGVAFGDMAAGFPGIGVEAKLYDKGEDTAWSALVFGGIHAEQNLFFRGGVSLSSRGSDQSDPALGISMGTTISFSWADLNAAFNYGSENRSENVFGYPEVNSVKDVITALSVGLTIPL
ncbi:hypothetical protein CSA37_01940 [Candidatus Fermentibacteria bacterium]|nr:MAG: hypothetical protein CSA37_01940 [Candidatus Fermentibacteria bacterium]